LNSVENVRIPCCDMEPPNRPCHSIQMCLTFGGQYITKSPFFFFVSFLIPER